MCTSVRACVRARVIGSHRVDEEAAELRKATVVRWECSCADRNVGLLFLISDVAANSRLLTQSSREPGRRAGGALVVCVHQRRPTAAMSVSCCRLFTYSLRLNRER